VLRHSGCGIQQGHLGSLNDSPARVGDQTTDAAPAGLAKRAASRDEENDTKSQKIPYGPTGSIPAVHQHPPDPKSQPVITEATPLTRTAVIVPVWLFISDVHCFQQAGEDTPGELLKRMNSAFPSYPLSRKKHEWT
jgi:hypothetical protein